MSYVNEKIISIFGHKTKYIFDASRCSRIWLDLIYLIYELYHTRLSFKFEVPIILFHFHYILLHTCYPPSFREVKIESNLYKRSKCPEFWNKNTLYVLCFVIEGHGMWFNSIYNLTLIPLHTLKVSHEKYGIYWWH